MNNDSPFRRLTRILLLAVLLLTGSATSALSRSAAIPLTIDYPLLTQLLVRAALRMLLVVSALDGLAGWEESEEKWAAEYVINL